MTDALAQVKNVQTQLDIDVYPIIQSRSAAMKQLQDGVDQLLSKYETTVDEVNTKIDRFAQSTQMRLDNQEEQNQEVKNKVF